MEKSFPDLIPHCLTSSLIPTHHRIRWPEPESHKLQSKSTSSARIFLHRVRRFSLGSLRLYGTCRLHRKISAGWRSASSYRPADPLAGQNHVFVVSPVAAAPVSLSRPGRMAAHPSPETRPHAMPRSWHARGCCVELLLLRCHRTHQRRDRNRSAVHRARLGSALRRRPQTTEDLVPESCRRIRCPCRDCAHPWHHWHECRLVHSPRPLRPRGGDAGIVLFRLLQRWRTPHPVPLRPLACSDLDARLRRNLLAVRQSAVEGPRYSLHAVPVGVSLRLFDDLGAGI